MENAGSMMEKFRLAIGGVLGIPTGGGEGSGNGLLGVRPGRGGEFAPVTDTRQFSPYTRKRIFFSTLPPAEDQWAIRGGRPPPWDKGWERRSSSGLGSLREMQRGIPNKKLKFQKIKPQPFNKPWVFVNGRCSLYNRFCIMSFI